MGEVFESVIEYLERECLTYEVEKGGRVIRTGLRGEHGVFHVMLILNEAREGLRLVVSSNLMVPVPGRAAVVEYLNAVNWHLVVGGLRMDPSDGEVVYHASVFTPGSALSPSMVGHLLLVGVNVMDAALPGLAAVAFAGLTADEGFELFEAESGLDTLGEDEAGEPAYEEVLAC